MVTHKLTRQRIKDNMSFGVQVPQDEREKRLKWSAEEDTERDYGGGWRVINVEILKTVPEEHRPTAINQMEKVTAIVTETKEYEL